MTAPTATQTPDKDSDSSLRDRASRAWGPVAAVFVTAVAAAGVYLWLAGGAGPDAPSSPQGTQATTAGELPQQGSAPRGTGLSQQIPLAEPQGLVWQVYEGVPLPISRVHGPTRSEGAVRAGFSRTPVGALLAVHHITTRAWVGSGNAWRAVASQQLTSGPGRDAYLAGRGSVSSVPEDPAVPAGFRFLTYSPEVAVIQVALRRSDGGVQVATVTARWVGGDWRVEPQPNGALAPDTHTVPDLTGFVTWGRAAS